MENAGAGVVSTLPGCIERSISDLVESNSNSGELPSAPLTGPAHPKSGSQVSRSAATSVARSTRRANQFGITKSCQAPRSKIFLFTRILISLRCARLIRHEGRDASSGTWVKMRWTPSVRLTRVRKADGEVVWACRPDAGGKLVRGPKPIADNGGTKAESHQGEHV